MKKFMIFVLGLVIGALAVYLFFPCTLPSQGIVSDYLESKRQQETQAEEKGHALGKNYFETAVEYTGRKSFQVNKVLENGDAMAKEVTSITPRGDVFTDYESNVLLECNPEMPYYDSQVVQAPDGKKALQVGIYRYKESKYSDSPKTIPIIAIR